MYSESSTPPLFSHTPKPPAVPFHMTSRYLPLLPDTSSLLPTQTLLSITFPHQHMPHVLCCPLKRTETYGDPQRPLAAPSTCGDQCDFCGGGNQKEHTYDMGFGFILFNAPPLVSLVFELYTVSLTGWSMYFCSICFRTSFSWFCTRCFKVSESG